MSQNTARFTISNEQLLLIDILNTMYNDNLRQIQNLTASNNEIRNLIIRLLNNNPRARTTNRQRPYNYRDARYTDTLRNDTNSNSQLLFEYMFDLQPYNASNVNANTDTPAQNDALSRLFQRFLEPIEIYPTSTQIEAATRVARYGDIINPRNRSCPISLENFNDDDLVSVIRFCGHTFNRDELNRWFSTNCRCPVCRYDIRNYNQNASELDPVTESNSEPRQHAQDHSSNAEELLNYILDPSGNMSTQTTNIIQNMLNNYQMRR